MKKFLILLSLSLLMVSLIAEDFMQPSQIAKDCYNPAMRFGVRNISRDQDPAPEYSFIPNGDGENTTFLVSSYYDYMPFSYNGYNLSKQPETSQPYGYQANGMFVSYMRSETQYVGTDRRAYYSYINPDGTLGETEVCNNSQVNREGFTSLAIDPYTGNPFMVWHAATEPDNSYDSHMSYALYHATGSPGAWRSPFIIFDNPEMSQPYTGHSDDEFIWPQVWVGPSPEAGHRRVHAYGNNYTSNYANNSNFNSLYLYADFDDTDMLITSDLDWTINSIPYFDNMQYNDIARVNKDLIVSEEDGQVAFIGSVGDSLFAMYSDDYGETFTKYTQQLKQPMDNPTHIDGFTPLWFNDDGITPAVMYIVPSNDLSHFNGVFTDNNTKVQWMSGVNYNSQENINAGQYFAAYIYPKIFTFDTETHEFSFYDIDVQDTDPADDHLAVAFDLDDDGEVDEYNIDGSPVIVLSCPSWFFNSDDGWQDAYFHESNCKMVANGDWVVAAWHDCAKLQNAYWEEEGYDGWYQQPEIAITISNDGGASWSDIRYINANPNDAVIDPVNNYDGNYAPELAGMLPVNISLGDKLEILSNTPGDYHAKLNFVFMDDGDYGSAAGQTLNSGDLTNSALRYAAIDLEFEGIPLILEAEFTADVTFGDLPLTINFTDLSTGYPTTWEWDFDNDGTIDSYEQNPTYTYTEGGLYTVSLTVNDDTSGDTETKVDYIAVDDPIIADFEADLLFGLAPLNVQFTDLSSGGLDIILDLDKNPNTPSKTNIEKELNIDSSREIISWEWDFDNDGTIDSYEQNPAYTYIEEGMYTVVLTVSDGTNTSTETKVDYITVGLIPPTNLAANLNERTGEVALNWNYGTGTGFYEDFEDGVADNWTPVDGNWSVSGNSYNVTSSTLEVSTCYYDEDFSNFEYEVRLRKISGSTSNLGIYFNGNPSSINEYGDWNDTYQILYSTNGSLCIAKIENGNWTSFFSWSNCPYINTGLGEWNVLKVVFSDGYFDVYINGNLQNSYYDDTFLSGKIGLKMYDSNNSGSAEIDYAILTEITDGYTFGEINQSEYRNIYSNINDNRNTETVSKIIRKVKSPIPQYGQLYTYFSNAENRDFLNFNIYRNSTVIGTTTATSYTDYLTDFGTYEYDVTAIYDEGESESAGPLDVSWEIEPLISDFEADPLIGLLPLNVQFTDLSSGGFPELSRESNHLITLENENSREVVSWEWDFDNDGTIDSYDQDPIYTYSEAGLFTVSLTVSDGINDTTETKIDYITVGEPIIAEFEADPLFGLAPLNVQFTDLSSGGLEIMLEFDKNTNTSSKTNIEDNSREIVSWEWDFDNDGTIDSYVQNPAHIYTVEGIYTVVLTVSDGTNMNTETKVDYITVGLIPPTDLTVDLDEVTGEVDLNWNYGIGGTGFYEDFEDGVADNWTPVNGDWNVSGGSYNVLCEDFEVSSSYYNQDLSNYEYEVRLRKTSGSSNVIGICFNGEPNPGGTYGGEWQNTYQLHYDTGGEWILFKYIDWNSTNIQSWINSPDLITGIGSWNTIRVDYSEGYMDIYFNNILQGTYYDDTFLSGKIGLMAFNDGAGGNAEYDYVSLTELTEGYTFGPVSQSKFRDVYSMNSQKVYDPDLPGIIIGQELASTPPYKGQYTFQPGSESRDFQNFNIYRNSTVIGTTTATSYTDDLTDFGTYEYEVTALYDEGESESIGPVYVEWLEPPDISVSPTSFSETLQVDETSTQLMTIYNDGERALEFNIIIEEMASDIPNRNISLSKNTKSENKLVYREKHQNRNSNNDSFSDVKTEKFKNIDISRENNVLIFRNNLAWGYDINVPILQSLEATVSIATSSEMGSIDLSPYDLVIFESQQPHSFYDNYIVNISRFESYLSSGGVIEFHCATYSAYRIPNLPFPGGMQTLYNDDADDENYIADPAHPIVDGAYDPLEGNSASHEAFEFLPADANTIVMNESALPTTVEYSYGSGKMIVTGMAWEYNYANGNNSGDLLPNALQYSLNISSIIPWLSVNSLTGIVPANSSIDIELTFDATDLEPDEYSANILINSNDPDDPLVTVPVTLEVINEVVPLVSDFEADPLTGLLPLNVQFTDLSTGGVSVLLRDSGKSKKIEKANSREIISWLWDFNNDGFIDSNEQNPAYTYSIEGSYTVSLTVSDGTNEDTEIKVDYITVNSVGSDVKLLPVNTQLYQNHPNPFNPLTTINFDIKDNESGTLTIFNIRGQIIESHKFESGKHNYLWDASMQASGIYFYKLKTQTTTETRKMILLK